MPPPGTPAPNFPITYINTPHKRKRSPKAAVACESCRRLKLKCDQKHPCSVCARKHAECLYREKSINVSKSSPHSTTTSTSVPISFSPINTRRGWVQPIHDNRSIQNGREDTNSIEIARPMHSMHVLDDQKYIPIAARPSDSSHPEKDKISSQDHESVDQAEDEGDPLVSNPLKADELNAQGFGEFNNYTSGTEFYGPTATLAFLVELQSRARSFQTKSMQHSSRISIEGSNQERPRRVSIVNYFHSDDPAASGADSKQPFAYNEYNSRHPGIDSSETSAALANAKNQKAINRDIEKECIQLYFANLHLIYYFLDKVSFIARCEDEMWSSMQQTIKSNRRNSRFPALYNAVVAVGAITAGDDTVVAQSRDKVHDYMKGHSNKLSHVSEQKKPTYAPLELAQVYFSKAKSLLSDLFEASTIDGMQTLLLMSIFCQYALKPHESYMYSGMAARTALSMGSATERDIAKNPIEAIRTWWCLYYHEMEVCCSLGRETFLREPTYYPVYFARFPDPMPRMIAKENNENPLFFARANTELANILKRTSEEIYHNRSRVASNDIHNGSRLTQNDKYQAALSLDKSLLLWKSQLLPVFDFENASLTEPETVTKRKIVLKLRFYSARILIHRPFLVAAAYQGRSSPFASNIKHCLDASQDTIDLLYDTFVNRPFFRTWWYNTAYAFNAITIILYAMVSHLQKGNSSEFLKAVEKSLKIFQAMDGIGVSRRCAELTQEIFEVAKMSVEAQQKQRNEQSNQGYSKVDPNADSNMTANNPTTSGAENSGRITSAAEPQADLTEQDENTWTAMDTSSIGVTAEEDFLASLIDPKILDSFYANFMGADLTDLPFFEGLDFSQQLNV